MAQDRVHCAAAFPVCLIITDSNVRQQPCVSLVSLVFPPPFPSGAAKGVALPAHSDTVRLGCDV